MASSDGGAADHYLFARLVLYPREVQRVPGGMFSLRVVSGRAWVTHAGRDVVLRGGERADLPSADDFAVVSALGKAPLVLEVLAPAAKPPGGLIPALFHRTAL